MSRAAGGRRASVSSRGGEGEAGAGSVLVVGLVAVVVVLAAALGVLGSAQVARAQAQTAADLAALAGAAALWTPPGVAVAELARPPGAGCAAAEEVVARNGAVLAECREDGDEVRVVTHRPTGLGVAVARARAGPSHPEG